MPELLPVVDVVVTVPPAMLSVFPFPILIVVRSVPLSWAPLTILITLSLVSWPVAKPTPEPTPTAGITVPLLVPPLLVITPEQSKVPGVANVFGTHAARAADG